ncbi:jg25943, partial [Pararge aegeria aegeria]
NRKQLRKPSIVIFDLKTDKLILRYEFNDADLVNERTPGGLTSITVDVTKDRCDDAYAYINDLATEGMIVYSLKSNTSRRLNHPSFVHDEAALNFTVAGCLEEIASSDKAAFVHMYIIVFFLLTWFYICMCNKDFFFFFFLFTILYIKIGQTYK